MTNQPNTPADEHGEDVQRTDAKQRLRWKTFFAVPLVLGCSLFSTCVVPTDGRPRASQESPEFERETLELITEYAAP